MLMACGGAGAPLWVSEELWGLGTNPEARKNIGPALQWPGEMGPTAGPGHRRLQRGGEEASDFEGNVTLPTPALRPTVDSFNIIPFSAKETCRSVVRPCRSPAACAPRSPERGRGHACCPGAGRGRGFAEFIVCCRARAVGAELC